MTWTKRMQRDFNKKYIKLVKNGDILAFLNARASAIRKQMEREGTCCCYACIDVALGHPNPREGVSEK